MAQTLYDRTIAFAGVCQAVKLVQQIARDGTCDRDALEACLNSIVVTDPSNTIEIFGCEANLRIGLETLSARLTAHHQVTKLPRYLVSVMALERKLSSRRDSMAQLGDRIDTAKRQIDHFELLDDQMVSNLANVYLDIISLLGLVSK